MHLSKQKSNKNTLSPQGLSQLQIPMQEQGPGSPNRAQFKIK